MNKKITDNKYYFMYGIHAVEAALNNKNRIIKKLYCLPQQKDFINKKFINNCSVEIVKNEFFIKKLGPLATTHQGIMAYVKTIYLSQLNKNNLKTEKDRVLILDQITDPHNIGAIIRTAVAFGFSKIILPKNNTPCENAIIAKTACGGLENIDIIQVSNINEALKILKNNGFWIAGLDVKGKDNISEIQKIDKLALVIGSEGKGIRNLVKTHCDFLTKIDINPKMESLNASNATAIICYLTKNS